MKNETEHKCKYCGAMTTQPDEGCYKAPDKQDELWTQIFDAYSTWIEDISPDDTELRKTLKRKFVIHELQEKQINGGYGHAANFHEPKS